FGYLHAIARGFQYSLRRPRILGLEVTVEGIDKQDRVAVGYAAIAEVVGAPVRQRAGRETDGPFQQPRQEIRDRRDARREWRVTRQVGDRTIAPAVAVPRLVVRQEFDLHARHVHTGGAFALAPLAGNAELERLLHGFLALGPELPRQREAQGVGTAAGEMDLVARGAVGRAHRAGVELAAVAVVVAHLDGLVVAAPLAPVEHRLRH